MNGVIPSTPKRSGSDLGTAATPATPSTANSGKAENAAYVPWNPEEDAALIHALSTMSTDESVDWLRLSSHLYPHNERAREDCQLRSFLLTHSEEVRRTNPKDLMERSGLSAADMSTDYFTVPPRPSSEYPLRSSKGSWLPIEDYKLSKLVENLGAEKWVIISTEMKTRSGKQCRERWHNHLDPSIKKDKFSSEEEARLRELVERYGTRWAEISKHMPGRPDNAIKNFWNTIQHRERRSSQFPIFNSFPESMHTPSRNSAGNMQGFILAPNNEYAQHHHQQHAQQQHHLNFAPPFSYTGLSPSSVMNFNNMGLGVGHMPNGTSSMGMPIAMRGQQQHPGHPGFVSQVNTPGGTSMKMPINSQMAHGPHPTEPQQHHAPQSVMAAAAAAAKYNNNAIYASGTPATPKSAHSHRPSMPGGSPVTPIRSNQQSHPQGIAQHQHLTPQQLPHIQTQRLPYEMPAGPATVNPLAGPFSAAAMTPSASAQTPSVSMTPSASYQSSLNQVETPHSMNGAMARSASAVGSLGSVPGSTQQPSAASMRYSPYAMQRPQAPRRSLTASTAPMSRSQSDYLFMSPAASFNAGSPMNALATTNTGSMPMTQTGSQSFSGNTSLTGNGSFNANASFSSNVSSLDSPFVATPLRSNSSVRFLNIGDLSLNSVSPGTADTSSASIFNSPPRSASSNVPDVTLTPTHHTDKLSGDVSQASAGILNQQASPLWDLHASDTDLLAPRSAQDLQHITAADILQHTPSQKSPSADDKTPSPGRLSAPMELKMPEMKNSSDWLQPSMSPSSMLNVQAMQTTPPNRDNEPSFDSTGPSSASSAASASTASSASSTSSSSSIESMDFRNWTGSDLDIQKLLFPVAFRDVHAPSQK